jgi:hypothetical protein
LFGVTNSARIIGPAIYGVVFAITISSWPTAIFWVSTGFMVMAFIVLSMVRLPSEFGNGDGGSRRSELEALLTHSPPDEAVVVP